MILYFIEERPYVNFVTDFEMDHIITENRKFPNVEEAEATSSCAALVAAKEHEIRNDIVACDDPATEPPAPSSPP